MVRRMRFRNAKRLAAALAATAVFTLGFGCNNSSSKNDRSRKPVVSSMKPGPEDITKKEKAASGEFHKDMFEGIKGEKPCPQSYLKDNPTYEKIRSRVNSMLNLHAFYFWNRGVDRKTEAKYTVLLSVNKGGEIIAVAGKVEGVYFPSTKARLEKLIWANMRFAPGSVCHVSIEGKIRSAYTP